MSTVHTRVTVMNLALDIVAEMPLQTGTEANPYARWMDRNFDHTVEVALRAHVWQFAKEHFKLNADTGFTNNTRWLYRYSYPPGALRLIPPRYNGYRDSRPIPHEVSGDHVYTDAAAPFYTTFIMRRLDPGTWDPMFAEVIGASLAARAAHKFTRKVSFLQVAEQRRQEALDAAMETNALEGDMEPTEEHDIIRVRTLG